MDVLLVIVTIASVLVAAAMSFIAWRLARDERARSAARVAALAADIASEADPTAQAGPMDGDVASPLDQPAGDADRTTLGSMFASSGSERSPLFRLGPALLAGVVLVGGVVGTTLLLSGGGETAAAAAAQQPRPLSLLSLRHTLSDGTVTIAGLVGNPAGNQPLERVAAIVFLFDDKGGFLASGRSLLDFTSLGAGEESPFVITMNAPPGVARYRVSFRRDEGGVIPHVDRRNGR